MTEIRIETVVENDGELHLRELPCLKGDHISAVVTIASTSESVDRELARQKYLALATQSTFSSTSSYPSRDELHARD